MVVDINAKSGITNIDEFFHQAELETSMLISECKYNSLLEQYMAISEGNIADKVEVAKKSIEVLKEKIKDLFKKAYDFIIESYTKIANKIGSAIEKKFASASDKEKLRKLAYEVSTEYLKNHPYYALPYPDSLDEELRKRGIANSSVEEILKDYETTEEKGYTDEIPEMFVDIVSNPGSTASFSSDVKKMKAWRDEMLKTMGEIYKEDKMIGDSEEQRQRYQNICTRIMNTYMANLKGYCKNATTRIAIYNKILAAMKKDSTPEASKDEK